ncbi:MAG: bacteriohopanetetrol glucosamine biosynthesis glycosyltransferase HpnI [Acidiphilium sp.]|nr:bacteriohopanetetrol glucosamine biosynthesis glycosyltransferase HpnI [Acidiphilium sp.]MDD4936183.1 bacteriohopanetetrol glucosamine biosynthesis glycosyltransferase HpnI [Acidiphilium sp.]
MVAVLPAIAEMLCIAGLAQQAIGSALIRAPAPAPAPAHAVALPPISILKPLHGNEPLLDSALESFFLLDYPEFQIVFGAENPDDPALAIVADLCRRYPGIDVTVVSGPTPPGRNRKVANLIAMLPGAKHETLVVSDADIHVAPDFLAAIAAALSRPGTGLVTTLYTGLPASPVLPSLLGAMQINHLFLPGAALAHRLGRRDCLGATMALTRKTLATIGGFAGLLDHLADDNVLGRRVRALGQTVALAPTIPATSVTETRFTPLIHHELRWARTIRALVPVAYWGMTLQFPLFWAAAALVFAGFATWAWIGLALAAGLRYALARHLEHRLGLAGGRAKSPALAKTAAPWLFLLRDGLSAVIFIASFGSDTVEWRGHVLQADSGRGTDIPAPPPAHELGSMR